MPCPLLLWVSREEREQTCSWFRTLVSHSSRRSTVQQGLCMLCMTGWNCFAMFDWRMWDRRVATWDRCLHKTPSTLREPFTIFSTSFCSCVTTLSIFPDNPSRSSARSLFNLPDNPSVCSCAQCLDWRPAAPGVEFCNCSRQSITMFLYQFSRPSITMFLCQFSRPCITIFLCQFSRPYITIFLCQFSPPSIAVFLCQFSRPSITIFLSQFSGPSITIFLCQFSWPSINLLVPIFSAIRHDVLVPIFSAIRHDLGVGWRGVGRWCSGVVVCACCVRVVVVCWWCGVWCVVRGVWCVVRSVWVWVGVGAWVRRCAPTPSPLHAPSTLPLLSSSLLPPTLWTLRLIPLVDWMGREGGGWERTGLTHHLPTLFTSWEYFNVLEGSAMLPTGWFLRWWPGWRLCQFNCCCCSTWITVRPMFATASPTTCWKFRTVAMALLPYENIGFALKPIWKGATISRSQSAHQGRCHANTALHCALRHRSMNLTLPEY